MASESIYFIKLIPSGKRLNFNDLKFLSEIKPEIIYNENIKTKKYLFLSKNIFKSKKNEKSKKNSKYQILYEINEELYDILFKVKENTFIYEIKLLKGNKFLDNIVKRKFEQKKIPLYNKKLAVWIYLNPHRRSLMTKSLSWVEAEKRMYISSFKTRRRTPVR